MKLKLIITTDLHGHIFPNDTDSKANEKPHGLARIATAIKNLKNEGPSILIDNGDAIQGTPLLTYANQNIESYTNPMAKAFNLLKYDYINLGNHDFNYGPKVLDKYLQENNAKLLTTNFTIDGKTPGKTELITVHNKKVAFIGAVTQYIPNWEHPDHIKNMAFTSAYEHIKQEVTRIKDEVDLIIAVYHGGFERDLGTGLPTEKLVGKNEGYQISQIEGLDILITGHQHRTIHQHVNGVYVTQTNKNAEEFITLSIDLNGGKIEGTLHHAKDYDIDDAFLQQFSELKNATQTWLDEPVGTLIDGSCLVDNVDNARLNKHPIVSLINQIQMEYTGADFSSFALFDNIIGLNETVTMRDIVSTYPYPNSLVLKEMSGHAIKAMLEHSADYYLLKEKQIQVNPRFITPKPQHYNYEMLDGLNYTIKVGHKKGHKITDMTMNHEPFELNQSYTIVVNNYRAQGGGHYTMIKEAKTIQEFPMSVIDIIYEYFKKHQNVKIKHQDNIKIIK